MQNGSHTESEWKPPHVEVGQIVLWNWNAAGKDASAAVVTSVGSSTINLSVHVTGIKDHVVKTGCRHIDDPFLKRNPTHDGGVWCLTARDQRINQLLAERGPLASARRAQEPAAAEK